MHINIEYTEIMALESYKTQNTKLVYFSTHSVTLVYPEVTWINSILTTRAMYNLT